MTKILFNLFFIFGIISCQSQTDQKYAESLRNCLTDSDVEMLNNATYEFEQKLLKHYGTTDHNENFLTYLTEIASLQSSNFRADFFLDEKSIKILNELEEQGMFNKIWADFVDDENQDEIPIAVAPGYEEEEEKKLELYVLNPDGDYLRCINKNSTNEVVKEILNSQSEQGDIAPSIIAGVLRKNLKKSDFENGLNKVIVAIGFYYDMVNLLDKNPR